MKKEIEIIKCDRCGKEFEEGPLNQASWLKPTLVYARAKFSMLCKNKSFERTMIPYDFCTDCAEDFHKWFNSSNKQNDS